MIEKYRQTGSLPSMNLLEMCLAFRGTCFSLMDFGPLITGDYYASDRRFETIFWMRLWHVEPKIFETAFFPILQKTRLAFQHAQKICFEEREWF